RPPPGGDKSHITSLMPTGVEFTHNFPISHAWMYLVLRNILARLRLPAQHVRSAGPSKGGRGNPKSFGSTRVDELLREFALGRNSGPVPWVDALGLVFLPACAGFGSFNRPRLTANAQLLVRPVTRAPSVVRKETGGPPEFP